MKKVFLLILLMICFIGIGCGKDKKLLKTINDNEIFEMSEKAYYIFFVKADCPYCKEMRPKVEEYLKIINSDKVKYKNNRTVYEVYVETKKGSSKIDRVYTGEGGQGTNNKFYVDGVTEWDDLYIASTPSLISIYEVNGVKKAKYLAQGKSKVLNFLEGTL